MKSYLSAWYEILTRVMEGFTQQRNLYPEWLVNPSTRRPLKLDLLYPEVGLAVRFAGMQVKQVRRRQSLEEEDQQEARDEQRDEVCAAHGVSLAMLDMTETEPAVLFNELELAGSRTARRLARAGVEPALAERFSDARLKLTDIRRKIKMESDLTIYAQLWHDRQYQAGPAGHAAAGPRLNLQAGDVVEHQSFGLGEVQEVTPAGDDSTVTIAFVEAGVKKFRLSLLHDKVTMP